MSPLLRRRPISAKRLRQREERRDEIVAMAGHIISRDGLDGLSMRRLATEVGVPAPTLYGYFRSKEAVIEALADQKVAILGEYVLGAAAGADPGIPRLLAFAQGYRQFALTNPDYYHLFIQRSASADPEDAEAQLTAGLELIHTLALDVRGAIERNQLKPVEPNEAIYALWATAHGYITLELGDVFAHLGQAPDRREHQYLTYVESVLRGLEVTAPMVVDQECQGT